MSVKHNGQNAKGHVEFQRVKRDVCVCVCSCVFVITELVLLKAAKPQAAPLIPLSQVIHQCLS